MAGAWTAWPQPVVTWRWSSRTTRSSRGRRSGRTSRSHSRFDHVDRDEIDRRVLAETRTMAIDRFLDRMPNQLAAGHQQLVQAARALVRRPSLFLLDEPLSRMDAANRQMMRSEIRLLQTGYGVTTLYATNDQEEAMAIADRIAVIDGGRLRQLGTPDEIYHEPVDMFVAGFVGSPSMSFLRGEVSGREVHLSAGSLPVPPQTPSGPVTRRGATARLAHRANRRHAGCRRGTRASRCSQFRGCRPWIRPDRDAIR